jgi:hypothetical protein
MKVKWFILIITFSLLPFEKVLAQDDCMNTLKQAKQLYEQGLIDDIPKILSNCMQSGFTRAQRIEAYKLIILTYLFDDNQYEAEKSMDEFLHKFPEYEVMPNDPVEFVYLLQSYKTSLLYSLNFFIGPNFVTRRIIEPYTTLDRNQSANSEKPGTGFQVGIGLSRNLKKSLNVNIDIVYAFQNYSYSKESDVQLGTDLFKFVNIKAVEKINMVSIPVSLSYGFGKGNFNYYVRLGGEAGFLTKSTLTLDRTSDVLSITQDNYDIQKQRSKYYYAALAGAGIEYKVPRGYLVLDIRYHVGLNNMTNSAERYSDPVLLSKYFYVDDDFAINYLSVNIGYYFSIYQSKKKKN